MSRNPDETAALALAAVLREHGHTALVLGREVRVGAEELRLARVNCHSGDYVLYSIYFSEARPPSVASGDTRELDDVVRAVDAWCSGLAVAALRTVAPFVERGPRMFDALVAQLPDGVRVGPRGHRLMFLTGISDRTCTVDARESALTCTLALADGSVALVSTETDVFPAIRAWLIDGATNEELFARLPGLEHVQASHYEWRLLIESAHDPQLPMYGELRALVAALAVHPVASELFPFTSHGTLCFSACSHYPWVSRGLPAVTPWNGGFQLRLLDWGAPESLDTSGLDAAPRWLASVEKVVEAVVEVLSRYPIRPFVGSARDLRE